MARLKGKGEMNTTLGAFCLVLTVGPGCSHVANTGEPVEDHEVRVGGGTIQVAMDSDLPVAPADVMEWVRRAAVAVTTYVGRYPVRHVFVSIKSGGAGAIHDGMTQAGCQVTIY